jgi:hypothetical protein
MKTEKPERVKLDFYALGRVDKMPEINIQTNNKGISDNANNILERNTFSLNSSKFDTLKSNFKTLHSLSESNKDNNNYLKPIQVYNHQEKYGIKDDMTNQETYKISRLKYFSNDKESNLQPGQSLSKADYLSKKHAGKIDSNNRGNILSNSTEKVINHNLFFDKNNKQMIRFPKNHWAADAE